MADRSPLSAKRSARFPALARLGLERRRQIPLVSQLTPTECGAACLTMVLRYHGKQLRLEDLRDQVGADRDGTDGAVILDVGRSHGMRGRGVKLEIEDLKYLNRGAILHWEFNHFVVFDRLRGGGVAIVDPASGRRTIPMDEFRRAFTGIAMVFEPSEKFSPVRGDSGSLWRYIAPVLRTSGSWTRIFVTSLLIQGFALAIPLFVGALVDRVVPRQDYRLLLVLGVALAGLVVFQVLTSLIRSHMLLHLRTVVDAHMTLGFLDHLVDLPYLFFQRRSAGDLMLRLNSNTIVREIVTTAAFSTLFDGTLVTLYLAILLLISPPIALVALILGVARVGIFLAIRRRQRELMAESLQKQAKSASYQFEMLAGIETLKAMGSEQRAVEHWSDLFVDVLNVSLARGRLGAKVGATMGGLGMASPLLILGYGV